MDCSNSETTTQKSQTFESIFLFVGNDKFVYSDTHSTTPTTDGQLVNLTSIVSAHTLNTYIRTHMRYAHLTYQYLHFEYTSNPSPLRHPRSLRIDMISGPQKWDQWVIKKCEGYKRCIWFTFYKTSNSTIATLSSHFQLRISNSSAVFKKSRIRQLQR